MIDPTVALHSLSTRLTCAFVTLVFLASCGGADSDADRGNNSNDTIEVSAFTMSPNPVPAPGVGLPVEVRYTRKIETSADRFEESAVLLDDRIISSDPADSTGRRVSDISVATEICDEVSSCFSGEFQIVCHYFLDETDASKRKLKCPPRRRWATTQEPVEIAITPGPYRFNGTFSFNTSSQVFLGTGGTIADSAELTVTFQ